MDNALLLYIKKIIYSLREMESVYTDIDYIKETVGNIKITVEDIYTGNQISEWVSDLTSFGTNSTTYKDASRMNVLITNKDACENASIDDYLFTWAVSNNKTGTFLKNSLASPGSTNWDSLTTPDSIAKNGTAFSTLCNDSRNFELFIGNSTCKTAIWNNSSVTESKLTATAKSILSKHAKRVTWQTQGMGGRKAINGYVTNIVINSYVRLIINYKDGTTYNSGKWQNFDTYTVNKFVNNIGAEYDTYSSTVSAYVFSFA